MAEVTNCSGCGRRCPINDLRCPRGERLLNSINQKNNTIEVQNESPEKQRVTPVSQKDQKLLTKISELGRYINYIEKDNSEVEKFFDNYSEEEKNQLLSLLEKFNYNLEEIKESSPHIKRDHHSMKHRYGHRHGHRHYH